MQGVSMGDALGGAGTEERCCGAPGESGSTPWSLWSETGRHQGSALTLRQGLSVWAPSRLNPFPGWNWPPTAKAMRVE